MLGSDVGCAHSFKECTALLTSGSSTEVKLHAFRLLKHVVQWQAMTYRIGMMAMKNRDAIGVASYDYLMFVAVGFVYCSPRA